jgi:succinate-semialdehyde dehydrogenase/glutarate-semialdehyde dehydrogenase
MTDTSFARRDGQLLIGPSWRDAASGARFDVTNPANGDVVGSVPDAEPKDVEAAIDASHGALDPWRSTTAAERRRILQTAASLIRERRAALAAIMTAEQGKPLAEAAGEVDYAAGFFDWFAGEAERVYGQVVPAVRADKRVLVFRQGVGVTAAITPWNFPAAMLTRKLGPAIAAGCTSIVKSAEATPLTAIEICRILREAGTPPGVVNLITSNRPALVADVIFGDARVRKVSFTGSTEVGKELIRRSAGHVQRLSLELGGHAPFIVFDDAEVMAAVEQVMASKFRNAGQTCICANRIYVQRGIYREFLDALTERVSKLVVGPGTAPGVALGPLIDADAVEKVRRHVEDAIRREARVTTGGRRLTGGDFARGHFFAPTVVDGITPEMLMSREETFGPVAGLTSFEREEDVIRAANSTPYGLAAYVQTRDFARIFRVAERLDFGVIGVNDGAPSNPAGPFGGLKASGFGREGGAFGIDEYLDVKFISIGGVHPPAN